MDNNISLLTAISKKLDVLYVEDDEQVRYQTVKMLENYFDNIDTASNGKEGLEKFEKNSYHIIFTDLEMPKMDGISMIEEIRKTNKHIPILVITSHTDPNYLLQTVNSGIDGYILKPYNFEQINKIIEKTIIKYYDINVSSKDKVKLEYGYVWDKELGSLVKDKKVIKLTKNETKMFEYLISVGNKIVTGEEIEANIFEDREPNCKRIRNLISRLKLKLKDNLVESTYGKGYRLKIVY